MPRRHLERHTIERLGWLRAAVLGANDGLLSTSSLIIGVASAAASHGAILLSGLAGLLAGALSMAAGGYVSVSSQRDAEEADLARERAELHSSPEAEEAELAGIYMQRGLSAGLAAQVAREFTARDALQAHARDELGLSEHMTARPVQAGLASATAFAAGAAPPLVIAAVSPAGYAAPVVAAASLAFLAILGALGAGAGGAAMIRPVLRVVFWGALAMAVTAIAGRLFGAVV
jgi:vacuolar iron transporter family protein